MRQKGTRDARDRATPKQDERTWDEEYHQSDRY